MIEWIIGAGTLYAAYKNRDKFKQNLKNWQQHSKKKIEQEHAHGIDTAGRRGCPFGRHAQMGGWLLSCPFLMRCRITGLQLFVS